MSSVSRVEFSVTRSVIKPSETSNSETVELVNLPTPAEGISYNWIVQSVQNAFASPEHNTVQVVELKYEDDEHDLITFSSEHEVLEAITVAEAAQQQVFRVYATIVVESKTSPPRTSSTEEKQEYSGGFRGILAQIGLYLTSLGESARESIADAVQVGIQHLKEFGDPKRALLDTLAMFPDSADVQKIIADVQRVSAEQWEQAKEFIKKIPEQTWAFIEASVPQLVNMLRSFGRNPGATTPFTSMFGGGGAFPAMMMGLMSSMGGQKEEKQDIPVPGGVKVDVEAVDELIPVTEPGMHVIRTWRVKNIGEVPLPEGVQLRAVVDPDNLSSSELSSGVVSVPRLNPGEATEVSQLLQAPKAEGAYNIVYALKTLYGQGPVIGPELPVELLVTEAY